MRRAVLQRLTYANVMATVAVFIALGGTSYAAFKITGRDVRDGSLTGADLADDSVTGRDVRGLRSGDVVNGSLLGKDFAPGQIPRGPAGPAGRDGFAQTTVRTQNFNFVLTDCPVRGPDETSCRGVVSATAECQPGETAVGAGLPSPAPGSGITRVLESRPGPSGSRSTQWSFSVDLLAKVPFNVATPLSGGFRTYLVCAR